MKKVFLTLFAVLMAVPAFAIEVYNNGDNTVEIYGHIHGYVGYGMGMNGGSDDNNGVKTTYDPMYSHNMLYGLQGNSRVGTRVKAGNFSGQFELGANEQTLRSSAANTIGFRQAWGAYTFGNGSRLLVGKTDTPTAMGGFISSFYDTDGGLNGFGGSPTGFRRFQVQYSIAGLTLSLIEDDASDTSMVFNDPISGSNEYYFIDNAQYTPRAGLSYVYQSESLLAKIAATYSAYEGFYLDSNASNRYAAIHAFGIVGGIKPYFNNKNSWLSFQIRYGMNEDMYGETGYGFLFKGNDIYYAAVLPYVDKTGYIYNMHRVSTTFEYGVKIHDKFTLIAGLGYQADLPLIDFIDTETSLFSSYAVFLQGQYSITDNFMLVPQIAYLGSIMYGEAKMPSYTLEIYEENNAIMAGLQLRVLF